MTACGQRVVSVLVRYIYDMPTIYLRCTFDMYPLFPARTFFGILKGLPQPCGGSNEPVPEFDSTESFVIQAKSHSSSERKFCFSAVQSASAAVK